MDQTSPQNAKAGSPQQLRSDSSADRERLLSHLREAVSDAEQWLSSAIKDGPADIEQAKHQFQETLRSAKTDLLKLEDSVLARGKLAAQAADGYVHDNPWIAVGCGAAVGLALGMLITRR